MTGYSWNCPVRMTVGAGTLRTVLAEEHASGRACLTVIDAHVAGTTFGDALDRWLRGSRMRTAEPVLVDSVRVDAAQVVALADRLASADVPCVVAVGGGTVMDLVKLAALAARSATARTAITAPSGRAGVIVLERVDAALLRRIFVPTTIGTGSEVSAVACLTTGGAHRLVLSPGLRADVAVLDPEATESLPRQLLLEGVLEALLRVAGPFISSTTGAALADAAAGMLAGELVRVGERMAEGDCGQAARLYAAELSAHTHTGAALLGRDPFGARLWYLANALSGVLGVRKTVATVALLPTYLEQVRSGDMRFGSPRRLDELWGRMRGASRAPDDAEPVGGMRRLLQRWGLDCELHVSDEAVTAATRAAARSWGGGLPMLGGLRFDDLYAFLRRALPASEGSLIDA